MIGKKRDSFSPSSVCSKVLLAVAYLLQYTFYKIKQLLTVLLF